MNRSLRKKPRMSYDESYEPSFDEYIFCSACKDHVYEYCSIHGALWVILDDKVRAVPSYVPRSALTIPHVFLHLKFSSIPDAGLGVFSTLALPANVRFGPYRGVRSHEINSNYGWQIYDGNRKPTHVIDAVDPNKSNWMRYVNCARHWSEQNLLAFQYRGEIYYKTLKIIPRHTELLVYYGSEFANRLGIDIRQYNAPNHKLPNMGSPVARLSTEDEVNKIKAIELQKFSGTSQINNTCATCNYKCATTQALEKHLRLHDENRRFKCNLCTYRFSSDKLLKEHIRVHTGEKRYKCDTCGFASAQLGNLKTHMRKHTSEKPFKCDSCKYASSRSAALKAHVSTHKGKKLYKCDRCDYASSNSGDLKRHTRTHTGEKPFKCELCGYASSHLGHLKRHMRTHTGEKPYKCDKCDYVSAQLDHLKKHIRKHTGQKPYQCSTCTFKCSDNRNLKTHMRTHTGEKPFKCDKCDYASSQLTNLKTHLKTHTSHP